MHDGDRGLLDWGVVMAVRGGGGGRLGGRRGMGHGARDIVGGEAGRGVVVAGRVWGGQVVLVVGVVVVPGVKGRGRGVEIAGGVVVVVVLAVSVVIRVGGHGRGGSADVRGGVGGAVDGDGGGGRRV